MAEEDPPDLDLAEGMKQIIYHVEIPPEYDPKTMETVKNVIDGGVGDVPGGSMYEENGHLRIKILEPNGEIKNLKNTLEKFFPEVKLKEA